VSNEKALQDMVVEGVEMMARDVIGAGCRL